MTPATPEGLDRTTIDGDRSVTVLRDLGVPTGDRLPEGVFLTRLAGTLISAPTGESVFVFDPPQPIEPDPEEANRPEPARPASPEPARAVGPMLLLPAQARGRMEDLAFGATNQRRFRISGEVVVYRGRNYLLPTSFSIITASAVSSEDAEGAQAAMLESLERDPSVESLIDDIVERRDIARGLASPNATNGAPAGGGSVARTLDGIAEGTLLTRTRGRLSRLPTGEITFSTDNGLASNQVGEDDPTSGPLLLLPSLVTQRLEAVAAVHGSAAPLEVSGRVYSYAGRRYLRPIAYMLEPSADIRPMQ